MLTLYSTPLCPFAHRVRIVISEKQLPVRVESFDLNAMPAEFVRLSPDGKVPLLSRSGHVVWDSSVINEYLDDAFPEVAMLPREPLARARARCWMRWADARLYERTSQLLHSLDPVVHARSLAAIEQDLRFLESHAPEVDAYWMGEQFTLVDATFHPWFEQFSVLQAFFGLRWPSECRRLARWRERVAVRPSVAATSQSADFYLERYGALRDMRHARSA